jgi:L-proline amide hydrolase
MYEAMWGPTEFFAPGSLKEYDVSSRLSDIRVPTLIICGDYDEAAPKSCQRYANMIDGAQTFIVPDAGHSTMREDEAHYLQIVRTFLAQTLDRE